MTERRQLLAVESIRLSWIHHGLYYMCRSCRAVMSEVDQICRMVFRR
eukprot:COSAG05_NODE_13541_length_426_cov_0.923547_1_plen_46_part_10